MPFTLPSFAMRKPKYKKEFTPFGLWIGEEVRSDVSVTNVDYVIEDYKGKRLMLIEEKRNGAEMHVAQRKTFAVMDSIHRLKAAHVGYDYWGFYLIQLDKEVPEQGVRLNGHRVSADALRKHLGFRKQVVPRFDFPEEDLKYIRRQALASRPGTNRRAA